jgi:hypothetical protein
MEKFKLIIRNGVQIILTPKGQELPNVTNTIIHQSVSTFQYNFAKREALAMVNAFSDIRLEGSVTVHGDKLVMPDGEILNVNALRYFDPIEPTETHLVGALGEVSFSVVVELPFDTNQP